MVALEYIAAASMRHDTSVALAFRRALGLPTDAPARKTRRQVRAEKREAYRGAEGCMRQRHGVTWRDGW